MAREREDLAPGAPPALQLAAQLPPRPGPELDRVLDAVERCLARHGFQRTSMTDIAREMGVARTTLYRQVGSLEEAMALVSSRRFHQFLDELVGLAAQGLSADTFTEVIVRTVRGVLGDPVAQRALHGEPEVLGQYFTSGALTSLAEQITGLLTPVVAAAMAAGLLRGGDADLTAGWIVRIVLSLGAVPPPDADLERTVAYVLGPLLDPAAG